MNNYTLTLQQIVKNDINIFDFDYDLFNPNYKSTFEQLFIDYFYLEEIGHETVGQFKHRLKNKLQLVLPYYNKLYMSQELEQRILDNYDVTETINREVVGELESISNSDMNRTIKGDTTQNSTNDYSKSGDSKQLYKDTPKTKIDIDNFDIVTNITKNIINELGNSNDTLNQILNNIENSNNKDVSSQRTNNNEIYTRKMTGNIGIQTDADAIVKYWSSLRNVTLEIFENELSSLFMGVY